MRVRRSSLQRLTRLIGGEVDRFCEEWVGWSLPPVKTVVEAADWAPTLRSEYCHRCGQTVGEGEAGKSGCASCRTLRQATNGVVRLGSYSEDLRQWIIQVKYNRWTEMGRFLGRELGRAVSAAGLVDSRKAIVVPMPMPWLRRMHRGIDHAHVLGAAVAGELGVPVFQVLRKANGPTQLRVPKSSRRINARHGMEMRPRWGGWPLQGLHIVLVDDVRTTGSSIAAAARLLRPLGPDRIVEAVLAVAESGRRAKSRPKQTEELVPA